MLPKILSRVVPRHNFAIHTVVFIKEIVSVFENLSDIVSLQTMGIAKKTKTRARPFPLLNFSLLVRLSCEIVRQGLVVESIGPSGRVRSGPAGQDASIKRIAEKIKTRPVAASADRKST